MRELEIKKGCKGLGIFGVRKQMEGTTRPGAMKENSCKYNKHVET
jgi:hypothetical protein